MKMRSIEILGLAVLAFCTLPSKAQSVQISGIAHIAYRASDLEKEVSFLRKLGFEQAFNITDAAGNVTEAFMKVNDRQFIEVYGHPNAAEPLGWMHVCYESGDINSLAASLTAHGLAPTAVRKAGAGNLLSTLKDPEGRVTEFTQYMAGSRHMLDKGLHLGEHRIAEEMIGFALPVPDLDAARKFYVDGMGFEARKNKSGLRMTLADAQNMVVEIGKATVDTAPQTIFRVTDSAKAEKQLKAAGLAPTQRNKRVIVRDPDGNVFAFIEGRAR